MLSIPSIPLTINISEKTSFEEMDHMLRRAISAENAASMITQAYFSTILLYEKWREAYIWADADTGELYKSPYEAPDGANLIKTDVPRYRTIDDWIKELMDLPGFARSTCYRRHKQIIKEMKVLGRSFDDALRSVMLSQGHSEMLLRLVTDEYGELDKDKILMLVPEPVREEAKTRIDNEGISALQEIASQRLDEDIERIAAGESIRSVNRDLRKQLSVGADYTIAKSDRVSGAFVIHRDVDGELTSYLVYIRDENDPTAPVPKDVVEWLARRLHVPLT